MSTKLAVKDFVIATRDGQTAPILFKVTEVNGNTFNGIPEKIRFYKPRSESLSASNVYVNLGPTPKAGKVYGCSTNDIYIGRQKWDNWGKICFFYKCPKETVVALKKAFARAFLILQKYKLDGYINPENCIWKIVGGKNKYAGMFEMSKHPDSIPHLFTIYPDVIDKNKYVYCILHEFAHYLHSTIEMGSHLNAQWIKLFSTSVKRSDISKQECLEYLNRLFTDNCFPGDLKSSLDEDDTLKYKWVLRWINQQHGLSVAELNAIWDNDKEYIRKVWPDISISYKDLAPIISEYACKNYRETFAEAFAFYFTKISLPGYVTRLVEKTISYLKANQEK